MIISGGENLYPSEIEEVLHEHPDVGEVAVVGRRGPGLRRAPGGVRRPAGGKRLHGRVDGLAKPQTARFKVPRECDAARAARNALGKVLRRESCTRPRRRKERGSLTRLHSSRVVERDRTRGRPALGEDGYGVTILRAGPDKLEQAATELRDAGIDVHHVAANMMRRRTSSDGRRPTRALGRLDLLMNNAGLGSAASIEEAQTKKLDMQIDVNLRAVYLSDAGGDPAPQGGGNNGGAMIVNTASIAGKRRRAASPPTPRRRQP